MSGVGLKLLVILPLLLAFGGLIWAVARRNAAERRARDREER